MNNFIRFLPKAELHVHLSGTLEPEQFLLFAERNKISVPYSTVEQAKKIYQGDTIEEFFASFTMLTSVIQTDEDFYDLTYAYLKKIASQGVIHTEIFFSLQERRKKNIKINHIINGIEEALIVGEKKFTITSSLILCFLRDLSEQSAFEALSLAMPYKKKILAVGLAGPEVDNPPTKFKNVFKYARELGYKATAHTGEESGPQEIIQALTLLHLDRIDHGVRCWQDPDLVAYLVETQIPLTLCPLSNVDLKIYPTLKAHPIKKMLESGLLISINSDDPSYFGYIGENYQAIMDTLKFTEEQLIQGARNSIISSFLDQETKNKYLKLINNYKNLLSD